MTPTNLSSSFYLNVLSHVDNANSVSLMVSLKVSVESSVGVCCKSLEQQKSNGVVLLAGHVFHLWFLSRKSLDKQHRFSQIDLAETFSLFVCLNSCQWVTTATTQSYGNQLLPVVWYESQKEVSNIDFSVISGRWKQVSFWKWFSVSLKTKTMMREL